MVVELPMPSAYRPVRDSRLGKALRERLPSDFCGRPVEWLDLSNAPGITKERFSDGLHLDRIGAALTSRPLGCQASTDLWPSGGLSHAARSEWFLSFWQTLQRLTRISL